MKIPVDGIHEEGRRLGVVERGLLLKRRLRKGHLLLSHLGLVEVLRLVQHWMLIFSWRLAVGAMDMILTLLVCSTVLTGSAPASNAQIKRLILTTGKKCTRGLDGGWKERFHFLGLGGEVKG